VGKSKFFDGNKERFGCMMQFPQGLISQDTGLELQKANAQK
jgi:hypothetical protein